MKRVSILTTFRSDLEAYSLNRVVINQLKMFLGNGYDITVIVAKGFIDSMPITSEYNNPRIKLIEISDVPVSNQMEIDTTFREDVDKLKGEFKDILLNTDVCLTHDLVYQPACIKHNVAIRELIAQNPEIKTIFLHWVHSAAQPAIVAELRGGGDMYLNLCKMPFPRSFYIAFNEYSIPRVASWFKIEQSDVKLIPHPHDFLEYKQELTKEIVQQKKLLEKDVICMYPVRLDRGKQVEFVIKIMHQVKETGRSIGCIIADFHSTGGDKVTYRNEMKEMCQTFGLTDDEVFFLSEFNQTDGNLRAEIPHQVIQELFDFTNTFILPSRSETYSLVAQEASAKKNFMILNQDFPPFRSIYGDAPCYKQFGSTMNVNTGMDGSTNVEYTNAKDYFHDIALHINYAQEHTRVLKMFNKTRKERNLNHVFKFYIEPLLNAEPGKYNY